MISVLAGEIPCSRARIPCSAETDPAGFAGLNCSILCRNLLLIQVRYQISQTAGFKITAEDVSDGFGFALIDDELDRAGRG
jgi:hypothetical protein